METQEKINLLKHVRAFIEYAKYELEDGPLVVGMQFPTKDCADKAIKEIDLVIEHL